VRGWVWDADMAGVLVVDEICLEKTFTSDGAAMHCKLATETVVMGSELSILWGDTVEEWVVLMHNDLPGIVSEEREWYLL